MSAANERQIGGDHYKIEGPEHWDLAARYEIGYLEGCATKYILRWRRKNGIQDLEKAIHYIEKRLEFAQRGKVFFMGVVPGHYTHDLCRRMEVGPMETAACHILMSERRSVANLERALELVRGIIQREKTSA